MINHNKVRPATASETINMAIDAPVTLELSNQDGHVTAYKPQFPLFHALVEALEAIAESQDALIVDDENRLILHFSSEVIHCDQRIMRIIEKIGETG